MSRILSCPIPSNINPLSPNGFMFSIAKLPEVTYFCQEVNLPSVALGDSTQSTPFVQIPIAGDQMDFSPLNIQFLIDSEMKNYTAIFNWMNGIGFPDSYAQHKAFMANSQDADDSTKYYSDATLQILNNMNKPLKNIHFIDIFPVSLESLTFTSTTNDVQYLVGNATFKYTIYKLE